MEKADAAFDRILEQAPEAQLEIVEIDLASLSSIEKAASQINRERKLDLLINNAGVMNEPAALWEVPVDEFSNVIDVNIKGVANVIRHFVPAMIERGRGVVVNFSSGWGRSTSPEVAAYCATKWAIEGLTQALAQELPNPLAAVPLNPGVINTDMLQQCFGSGADGYPDPKQWSKSAVRLLLGLDRKDNGQSLSV